MRPTDETRNQDLPRSPGDHSTLYVSLELSRSTWLVTSLSPNSDKMSKHSIAAGDAPNYLPCWRACAEEPSSSSEGRLMSWSSKKPASTVSGYIDRSRQMTLKAMWSILRRFALHQPAKRGRLCWAGADAMAKWLDRPGAKQSRQSASAPHHD